MAAKDDTRNGGSASDAEADSKPDSAFRAYCRVFNYCDAIGWCMNAVALVCMIASGTLLPLMDLVFGQFVTVFNNYAIGEITPARYREEVNKYTLYFIYLFVAKFTLGYIWTVLVAASAIRTTKALRIDFLRQTLRQEIPFFESPDAPSVATQITTNGNLVNQGISEKLGLIVQACSSFVTAFIVAFAVHWKLTLIIVGIVPVNLIVTTICVAIDAGYESAIMGIYNKAGAVGEEAFSTIRTVHAFCAYPRLSKKFAAILDDAKVIGDKKGAVYAVLFSIEFFVIYSAYGLAFWQGITMYARGEIAAPGTIVTVIFAIVVAAQALTQIAPQTVQLAKAMAAAQELFVIINRVSKTDSLSSDGLKPSQCNGDIEIHDLQFAYPSRPGVPVLKGIHLNIPANKTTALVGPSGSGKSTIVGLIERWYSPTAGRILLDGADITDLNLQWLRTNIRLVQQEPTLFNGSIYENVVFGLVGTDMNNASEEEKRKLVQEACEAAFAHEFIEKLPEGYETQIGERGATLSGGQRQRIVIARSIVSNPRVLLLDEATSALDPKAEKIVQQALNNVAVGRTMLVIAHRLSTIRTAANIVVMSQGSIVEQGTHGELMDSNGVYARLVQTQDLGQKAKTSEESQETGEPAAEMAEKITSASAVSAVAQGPPGDGPQAHEVINYSLMKCLVIILVEQKVIWLPMAIVTVACIAGGLTFPAIAILFSEVMSAFELQGSAMTDRGNFFSLMFFVVALGNLVAYALLGWVGNIVSQSVLKSYKQEIFDNTLRQEMQFFDDPLNTTGALTSRLSSEPTNLMELISINFGLIIINLVNLVSSCILAIVAGWKLGLVLVFGALPPLVFSGYLRIRLEFKLDSDTAARFASSSGIASEAVMAIRTVSSLALENDVLRRYKAALHGLAQKSIRSLGWRMFWYALSQSISFLAMALGFWYGGRLISFGEYTPSQFYIVFIATIFSGESAAAFFQYGTSITKARTSANYIFELRRQLKPAGPNEYDDDESGPESAGSGGAVSCEALQFAYPRRPDLRVLSGVSIKIEPGQFVAFVGHSGCGKTTMISLLERFYDPTSGTILFDERDILFMPVGRYRGNLALVQQEPVLYQGSVRENVSLGIEGEDPSDEDIMAACKQANIWDFIASLPDGLGTPCGSQGLQLSGGQRQRIAIARALIRKPRLLLLDEATSALDTESEKVVKAALDSAAQGRTTVAVAHRLSTVMDADRIFVFSHGRIVESGSHRVLLDRKGIYYEMCLGQSLDRDL